jgi:hypothetical protein
MIAFGSGDPTRAICSGLIAQSFETIGYPVLPDVTYFKAARSDCPDCVEEVTRVRHHSLYVPRDFDVSPYFEIVKPNLIASFNYRDPQMGRETGRPARYQQILILARACCELFGVPGGMRERAAIRPWSAMVLELRLGVERLRRRGGNHGGRGRRGASRKSGKNGAGDKDAKVFGHLRILSISAGARVMSRVRAPDSQKSAIGATSFRRGAFFLTPSGPRPAIIAIHALYARAGFADWVV